MPTNDYDFNNAGSQRSFEPIPAGTICTLQLNIRRGGAGDGWLKSFANGACEGLDCEFIVVDGPYANRKLWKSMILRGTTPGHADAADISRKLIKAILESIHGIHPDDKSEAAERARTITSFADLNGVRFMARLGVTPPSNGFAAKNTIMEVITPERHNWIKVEQIQQQQTAGSTPPTSEPPPATGAITRPDWAKDSNHG